MIRLRQICLVAADIGAVEADIEAVFALAVCFRDAVLAAARARNCPVDGNFVSVCGTRVHLV